MLKKKKTLITVEIIAFLLAMVLHAGVIGAGAYIIGYTKAAKQQAVEPDRDYYAVTLAVLPGIKDMRDKSAISKSEGSAQEAAQEFGSGSAIKKESDYTGEESLKFYDMIRQRIEASRHYPEAARRAGIEGKAGVSFTIARDGTLLASQVTGSSGNELLDREALDTVARAAPFPGLPAGMTGGSATISVSIVFRINQ